MEISKYHIFMEVVRHHSFSKAAEVLGYTQSGVSHTLKRMEDELGLTLFYREQKWCVSDGCRGRDPFLCQPDRPESGQSAADGGKSA